MRPVNLFSKSIPSHLFQAHEKAFLRMEQHRLWDLLLTRELPAHVFCELIQQDQWYLLGSSYAIQHLSKRMRMEQAHHKDADRYANELGLFAQDLLVWGNKIQETYLHRTPQSLWFKPRKICPVIAEYRANTFMKTKTGTLAEAIAINAACPYIYHQRISDKIKKMPLDVKYPEHKFLESAYNPKFIGHARLMEEIANVWTMHLTPHEKKKANQAFNESMQYEIDFFDYILGLASSNQNINIPCIR